MARPRKWRTSRKHAAPGDLGAALTQAPQRYAERCREVAARTDAVCDAHLNDEYKTLCRRMAAVLCADGSPVVQGEPEGWAAGIVYALGRVNFLTDPNQEPHMTAAQIAAACGVSQATMMSRANVLNEGLELMPFHPDWCLPSRLDDNPLVWMLEVNGLLMDVRYAPREMQVEAYELGLLPYAPADRD